MRAAEMERLPRPVHVALAVTAAIGVLAALGAVQLAGPDGGMPAVDLDREHNVPSAFSALLLVGAAGLAWLLAMGERAGGRGAGTAWLLLTALFAFMGLDEGLALHERVSAPVTGMSWQVFYAPLALVAMAGWAVCLRRLPGRDARAMWVGGAGAWLASQLIEAIQWDGRELVYAWTFVPEEALEMTGSLLFGLAMLVALRRSPGEPPG